MSANDIQHGGNHYKDDKIQVWDFILANNIGYMEGSAIKYLSRWKKKGGLQDLHKAAHFIARLIEEEQANQRKAEEQKAKHNAAIQRQPAVGAVDRYLHDHGYVLGAGGLSRRNVDHV